MRLLALAVLLAGMSSAAFAADPPNLIGTWVPVSYAEAYAGKSGGHSDTDKPVFTRGVATAWSYVIDRQEGYAFSGSSKSPTGESGSFVGVLAMDGKHFTTATGRGSHAGELMGDKFELCWTDNVDNYIGVSCAVYQRQ